MTVAAWEIRASYTNGDRFWYAVQAANLLAALRLVRKRLGFEPLIEYTGRTFKSVKHGASNVELLHSELVEL